MDQLLSKLPALTDGLGRGISCDLEFAEAITTTDTATKSVALEVSVPDASGKLTKICVGGVAKGAGMIHPNMATMLSTLTTDVRIEHEVDPSMTPKIFELSARFHNSEYDSCDQACADGVQTSTNAMFWISLFLFFSLLISKIRIPC